METGLALAILQFTASFVYEEMRRLPDEAMDGKSIDGTLRDALGTVEDFIGNNFETPEQEQQCIGTPPVCVTRIAGRERKAPSEGQSRTYWIRSEAATAASRGGPAMAG